jgi:hypothetical protein
LEITFIIQLPLNQPNNPLWGVFIGNSAPLSAPVIWACISFLTFLLVTSSDFFKKGNMVLYTGYSSEEMEIDGEKYLILDVKDIIAKIEG